MSDKLSLVDFTLEILFVDRWEEGRHEVIIASAVNMAVTVSICFLDAANETVAVIVREYQKVTNARRNAKHDVI